MSPNVLRKLRAVDDAQKAKDVEPDLRVLERRQIIADAWAKLAADMQPDYDRLMVKAVVGL